MKRSIALVAAAVVVSACTDAPSDMSMLTGPGVATQVTGDYVVTNSNDAGTGSFREAITQANASAAIATIAFEPSVNTIALQSTITYSGTQNLTINGNHATLDASAAGGSGFVMQSTGNNLTIVALTVRGAAGEGVRVNVDPAATDEVVVSLTDVQVTDNKGHGFLVEDQENPGDVTDADGSGAAVRVSIVGSSFLRNGFSVSDRDGVRIDEGGAGDLNFTMVDSRSDGNGADGIELDERGAGDVIIDVQRSHMTRNGIFDPTDFDDGFDIDEANEGSITGSVVASSANHNYEEGFDFNENHAGNLAVDMTDVEASFNAEEGIDYEEDDETADDTDADDVPANGDVPGDVGGGNLVTVMNRVTTNGNAGGDGGLKIREKGPGNATVTLSDIIASQNVNAGIQVRETEAGNLVVSIDKAVTNGNVADGGPGDGIEIRESNAGNITSATVRNATTSGNTRHGVSAPSGATVGINNVNGGGNGSGLLGVPGAIFNNVP